MELARPTFALAANTQTESTAGFVCGPDPNGLVKLPRRQEDDLGLPWWSSG